MRIKFVLSSELGEALGGFWILSKPLRTFGSIPSE